MAGSFLFLPSTFSGFAGRIGHRWTSEVRSQRSEVRTLDRLGNRDCCRCFLLLPVRLFEIANPEWRLLGWFTLWLVVTLTLLLFGAQAANDGFAILRSLSHLFLSQCRGLQLVEAPVIQGLMRIVAHVAAETAMLLGIPAQVEGNLIRVSTGLVGVNEACSGIRSLQTSLMIGLLFGELKRLSVLRRVALVVGAVAIALFANFLRAVFLVTVAATENISEVARWHDIAGYTISLLFSWARWAWRILLGKRNLQTCSGRACPERSRMGVRSQPGEGWSPARI